MADKLTPLILDALARAAADPAGTPLYASKSAAGLFPAVAAARAAAAKCLEGGLLRVVRTEPAGKGERELYAGTPAGLNFLVDHSSPKQVLDDFARLLEEKRDEVGELLRAAERMASGLDGMRQAVAAVLPSVWNRERSDRVEPRPQGAGCPPAHPVTAFPVPHALTELDLCGLLLTRLRDWTASDGSSRDCPLPELFGSLSTLDPAPTVGQFHDALRRLHADGRIYLHPWTGPLYALPEPSVALLVGHEVGYYASVRAGR